MKKVIYLFLAVVLVLQGCREESEPNEVLIKSIEDLEIPEDFSYDMSHKISVSISDFESGVKYAIYSRTSIDEPEVVYTAEDTIIEIDHSNQLLAEGFVNGTWVVDVILPKHQQYIYVKRLKPGGVFGELIRVTKPEIEFVYSGAKSFKSTAKDWLFAVNNAKQLLKIDPDDGTTVLLKKLPVGSFACAVDKANNVVYIADNKSPYMLRSVNIDTGEEREIGKLNKNFARMAYDEDEAIIYLGKDRFLYSYDPFLGQYVNRYELRGEHARKGGGDVSIGDDGYFYFTSVREKSLYRGKISGEKIYLETITNSLPTVTTSSSFCSDGYLYYGNNEKPAKIYRVDVENGNAQFLYALSSNYRVNDLGTLRVNTGGGNAGTGQGSVWTPGENMWGTLAFEDLWPSKGDYDFNDLVLNYKIHQITNQNNDVTSIEAKFLVKHIGATFINGFAFELPVSKDLISNVEGQNITDGVVSLDASGAELGQDNAVIVVFDNANENLYREFTVTVTFTAPVSQSLLGNAPYNPFIIKNKLRDYEVHLPDMTITNLADQNHLGTMDDDSNLADGRSFKTFKNLPWAINIPVEFVWPKEKVQIIEGYLHFAEWAESGGSAYPDWYKDIDGYRNESSLDL